MAKPKTRKNDAKLEAFAQELAKGKCRIARALHRTHWRRTQGNVLFCF
jgi:hypothetical protein